MKTYTYDVRLTGWEQITVKAKSGEEAKEKALQKFEDHYVTAPAWDLRCKSIELEPLNDNARDSM